MSSDSYRVFARGQSSLFHASDRLTIEKVQPGGVSGKTITVPGAAPFGPLYRLGEVSNRIGGATPEQWNPKAMQGFAVQILSMSMTSPQITRTLRGLHSPFGDKENHLRTHTKPD
jgi:hypothetical protein